MTAAINEACIGEGDFSGSRNGHFFCCWTVFFRYLQSFSQMVGLGEGAGKSMHGRSNGKMIQGDNFAGHCFVLRDFIPMTFSK